MGAEVVYQDESATIWRGDCLDVLHRISGVNLFFTSPPYNQSIHKFNQSGIYKKSKWIQRISSSYVDAMPEEEYQQWQIEACNACFDAGASDASMFYNHKVRWRKTVPIFPMQWLLRQRWRMRQEIIWARNGSVTLNARMFPPSEERIYWMVRGHKWKWNRETNARWPSVWTVPSAARSTHPAAFPIELPSRAILSCTEPEDTVLDPFCGGGTTLLAALKHGRRAIGIEIDEKWANIAADAVVQWRSQGELSFKENDDL